MTQHGEGSAGHDPLEAEKEALLKLLLEEEQASAAPPAPVIARADRTVPLALSFAQERLWFLEALAENRSLFLLNVVLKLRGPLVERALAAAIDFIVARHEILRSAIVSIDGTLTQAVRAPMRVPVVVEDLTGLPEGERVAAAAAFLAREAPIPFDLAEPPLIRARLARLSPTDHRLGMTLHHIVVDDTSVDVLLRDFSEAYAAAAQGRSPTLPELPIQYADFAVHQREWLRGERLDSLLSFWTRQLANLPGPI
ncbi:MAG: non-ribosomal peptide synthetase, partial [Alphaproteobacteria bacterium]|nr:non-ribosomal peptide synthetase [Alphaproteobacteria bacterium]